MTVLLFSLLPSKLFLTAQFFIPLATNLFKSSATPAWCMQWDPSAARQLLFTEQQLHRFRHHRALVSSRVELPLEQLIDDQQAMYYVQCALTVAVQNDNSTSAPAAKEEGEGQDSHSRFSGSQCKSRVGIRHHQSQSHHEGQQNQHLEQMQFFDAVVYGRATAMRSSDSATRRVVGHLLKDTFLVHEESHSQEEEEGGEDQQQINQMTAAAVPGTQTTGDMRALYVRVRFPNKPAEVSATAPIAMFQRLQQHFPESSFNKARLTGWDISRNAYMMPQNSGNYANSPESLH